MHETLIAPFDFPVYKSENDIAAEKDSILASFSPYYELDTTEYTKQEAEFDSTFDLRWQKALIRLNATTNGNSHIVLSRLSWLKDDVRPFIKKNLQYIYSHGILGSADLNRNPNRPLSSLQIVRNNIATLTPIKEIFTERSAYHFLISQTLSEYRYRGNEPTFLEQILQNVNLNDFVKPNLSFDTKKSEIEKRNLMQNISLTQGMVLEGERIISKGERVNDKSYQILESLRTEYNTRIGNTGHTFLLLLGQFLVVFLSVMIIFFFLQSFRKEVFRNKLKTFFILFVIILMALITRFVISSTSLSVYIVPFALLAIIVKTFYDSRLALFVLFVTILLTGFWVPNSFEFVFMNFIAGIVAIFSLSNQYRRGKLFLTAMLVLVAYSAVYTGISLMEEAQLKSVAWNELFWFGGNCLLLLAAYPLLFIFERLFGFLSDASLTELSDTNQPLLRQLAELAPGTFQHSLQVANLAEEAVNHIGGNALLVRTGALYHDIGKMENPSYFIENQPTGVNLHEQLDYTESAAIIIDHVKNGITIARKHKLPEQIVDFIATHHGTTMARYFYNSLMNAAGNHETADPSKFRYPGPKPHSKENAVLMMADAVEAASRSLTIINEESLSTLVNEIIDQQMKEEQLNEADITFGDITLIKNLFTKRLRNIYHARIAYPKLLAGK